MRYQLVITGPPGMDEITMDGPYWPREDDRNLAFLRACGRGLRDAGYDVRLLVVEDVATDIDLEGGT